MPVSSPSYFPPQRFPDQVVGLNAGLGSTGQVGFFAMKGAAANNAANEVIAIGEFSAGGSASATGIASTVIAGTIAIGDNALGQFEQDFGAGSTPGANISIGHNTLANTNKTSAMTVIGDLACQFTASVGIQNSHSCVVLGAQAGQYAGNGGACRGNVILGYQAAQGANAASNQMVNNVIIGNGCANGTSNGTALNGNVIIGSTAVPHISAMSNAVIIGSGISGLDSTTGGIAVGAIVIGSAASCDATAQACIGIGSGVVISASALGSQPGNIAIGTNASIAGSGSYGSVVIGTGAGQEYGSSFPITTLLIETTTNGSSVLALIAGNFSNGNLILGNSSTAGVNRGALTASGSSNIVLLLNGTPASGAVTGGGYFYVSSGALHFVGGNGTDTTLAVA